MNIELFSCSGGMAEGFRRAGIVFDFAFDKDPNACDSYEKNHGHRPIEMDVRDLVRLARRHWTHGRIRLLVADPPCTPWSRAGKRLGVEDERDMLGETTELIRLLRPDAYLIGNVPGLDDSTQWRHLQDALAPLHREGYCIADYSSLAAADFGVPQHRVRPFWFGHLRGPCIRWPQPTHGPPANGQTSLPGTELKPWVTCREALGHLSAKDLGRRVRLKQRAQDDGGHPASEPDIPSRTICCDGGRAGRRESVMLVHPDHNLSHPDAPAKTVTRNTHGDGAVLVNERHPPAQPAQPAHTLGAKDRGQSTVLEWPWSVTATTVCQDNSIPPPGEHPKAGSILSVHNAVVLSEKAATILQGFPESWVFAGKTKKARWSQLGQAMPPALAHAVATAVVEQLAATKSEAA